MDCNYPFPIDLAPNGTPFRAKSNWKNAVTIEVWFDSARLGKLFRCCLSLREIIGFYTAPLFTPQEGALVTPALLTNIFILFSVRRCSLGEKKIILFISDLKPGITPFVFVN